MTDSVTGPNGPAYLYRTTDGGAHWQPQLSWDAPGAQAIKVSPDGMEALVVGAQGDRGTALFHTIDAGAHWVALALPLPAEQGSQVYFLNPREGWVLSDVFGVAEIFHTSDSGLHWRLVSRLVITAEFNLGGQLIMVNSSHGWFVPGFTPQLKATGAVKSSLDYPPFVYLTRDGGVTWQAESIKAPTGATLPPNSMVGALQFFNDREGVLELFTGICSSTPCSHRISTYVYTTSNGGTDWTFADTPPGEPNLCPIVFTDSTHWLDQPNVGPLLRTNDAGRHWLALAPGLPPYPLCGYSFVFLDSSNGWAIANGLYRTTDGGANWTQFSFPS